ncbi:MAG: sugar ABC transporter permease [Desulfobulbaceae bacterium]|nr:MAG: sugar ABC transporter permease [Desulfobulbaceae bacterium]
MQKPVHQRAFFFILPAVVVVSSSLLIPLIAIINFSVQDVFYGNDFIWVGIKWFSEVLNSKTFYATLFRTLAFSTLVMIIEVPLGILIARCLPKKGPLVPLYLIAIAIPLMIPWVVVGLIWSMMIHPQWGSFGALLSLVNLSIDINNLVVAWCLIIFVDVWHWTSLVVLLCYSGLVAIPDRYYQAARIDGASRWAIFRYVELPKIKRVLLIALLLRFLDSFFVYVEPFIITRGGPGEATVFLSQSLMRTATKQFDLGYSAAVSLIYLLIILLFSWILYKVMNR